MITYAMNPKIAQTRCPACASLSVFTEWTTDEKKFYACRLCGHIFQDPPRRSRQFDDRYFLADYRKQYGRTYIEDRPNIARLAETRRAEILRLLKPNPGNRQPPAVCDIGCALGFFLFEMEAAGFQGTGIEVSAYAVRQARHYTKARLITKPFLQAKIKERAFDCVSMWYYLEHEPDMNAVLAKAARLLLPGGILAIACPNGAGFTKRFETRRFYETHPSDHYHDFCEASLSKTLGRHGFKIEKIKSTGIHYSRFQNHFRLPPILTPLFSPAYEALARLMNLGDTFELYARKPASSISEY